MHLPLRSTLLCVAIAAVLVSGCSKSAKRERHLSRAEAAFAKGEYQKAEIEYLNASRLGPADPNVLKRLGHIYYAQGRNLPAYAVYRELKKRLPEDVEVRRKLGLLALMGGSAKEARDEALFILDKQPKDTDAILLLAQTATSLEEAMATRLKLEELAKAQGPSWPVHIGLAELAFRENKVPEAEKQIAAAAKLKADAPEVNIMQARLGLLRRDTNQVTSALQAAFKNAQPRTAPRLQWADYQINVGQLEGAQATLDTILKESPDLIPAIALRVRLAIAQKDYKEAERLTSGVLNWDFRNVDISSLHGRVLLVQGKTAEAIKIFERLTAEYPRVPMPHYDLAVAHVQNGDREKALKELETVLGAHPTMADAVLLYAQLKLRSGEADDAVNILLPFARRFPENDAAQILLGNAYFAQGKFDLAEQVFSTLVARHPNSPELLMAQGSIYRQQRRFPEARTAFNKVLSLAPDAITATEQLVDIDIASNDLGAAEKRALAEVQKLQTNPVLPLLILTKVQFAKKDTAAAEATLKKIIDLDPKATTAYALLAQLYITAKKNEAALAPLNAILEREPKNITALMLSASILESKGEQDEARRRYETLLSVNPNFAPALNNLAFMSTEKLGKPQEGLNLALKARELAPTDPFIADTLGWAWFKRGEYTRALPLLRESASKLPDNAQVLYHLALTHYVLLQEAEALALFQKLSTDTAFENAADAKRRLSILQLNPQTASAQQLKELEQSLAKDGNDALAAFKAAEIHNRISSPRKAVEAYEQASKLNPRAILPHVRLASLHGEKLNEPSKALTHAKAAYSLAPQDLRLAGTLGRIALRAGDFPWALSLLEQANNDPSQPAEQTYYLAYARYFAGNVSLAVNGLQDYLRKAPQGPAAQPANELLQMISFQPGTPQSQAVLRLAQTRLQNSPNDVAALMVSAQAEQAGGDAKEAAENFERIISIAPNFAPAWKGLAVLWSSLLNNDQKAAEALSKARRALPDDADLDLVSGKLLYRRGDFAAAANILRNRASQRTHDAEWQFYLGMASHKAGRTADAKAALQRVLALKADDKHRAEATSTLASLR
jgi:tetratricopeptide (TPR) repeat protein